MRSSSWNSLAAAAGAAVALWASSAAGLSISAYTNTPVDHTPYPTHDCRSYVGDHAGVLTEADKTRIDAHLRAVERRTGVQIIVVTVRSIGDYRVETNRSIETFARGMFDRYGIGDRQENKGVLLLVAVDDRKARIELGAGYGRGRNDDARRILDERILPRFKEGDCAAGLTDGVEAIMLEFAGTRAGWNWMLLLPFIGIAVIVPIAWSLFRNGKTGWGWVCVGLVIILVLVVFKVLSSLLNVLLSRRRDGWYGGWYSSRSWGGSSGGGSSFGGGFSGGGGATGSW
ncbi:MAG TPA: TPM domain-containing protein [Phycisphaerae bacterium]|nr:TPM domain-containing protein [Phycisphaerae bacterium]